MKWLLKNLEEGTKIMKLIFKHALPKGMNDLESQDGYTVEWRRGGQEDILNCPYVILNHPRATLFINYFDAMGAIEDGDGPKVWLYIRDIPREPEEDDSYSYFNAKSHYREAWSSDSKKTPWLLENIPDIIDAHDALPQSEEYYLGNRGAIKHLHFMRDTFLALRGK